MKKLVPVSVSPILVERQLFLQLTSKRKSTAFFYLSRYVLILQVLQLLDLLHNSSFLVYLTFMPIAIGSSPLGEEKVNCARRLLKNVKNSFASPKSSNCLFPWLQPAIGKLLVICFAIIISNKTIAQATDDYRTRGTGNWNGSSTWQRYDGSNWQNISTGPTNSNKVITIRNGHTVTVTANVTADQVTIDAGGQITVNSTRTLTIADGTGTDMTVNGTLANNGTTTINGTLSNTNTVNGSGTYSFSTGSEYIHAKNGGTIPTATWNASSTCTITGITGSAISGLGQSFGNFTWNCTGQSSHMNLNGTLTTVNGNFTISSTNNKDLVLTNATDLSMHIGGNFSMSGGQLLLTDNDADVTINTTGNFSQSGGSINLSAYSQIGALEINVTGNFLQTGGSFDFVSGGANTARTPALKAGGNFSQSGAATMTTSSIDTDITNGTITFNKNGTQTFNIATQGNLTQTNFIISASSILEMNSDVTLTSSTDDKRAGCFTVNNAGTLDAKTNRILSSLLWDNKNDFVLNSGATIMTANTNGIQSFSGGTISLSIANRTFDKGANYIYNGASPQNSGIFTTNSFPYFNVIHNLTVNNTGGGNGLTLEQPFRISGTCYFTAGRITSSSSNLLIFNDNAIASGANNNLPHPSYVNGPVRKIGNDAFTFPVGKSNVGYMACGISAPGSASDAFTVEYMRNSATALGNCTAPGLYRVSACEYWQLDRTTGSSNVNVTLSWSGLSPCNAAAYVNDLASLVVAHFDGSHWNAYGNNGGVTGNGTAGTVTWNNVSSFSPFTLGSTSPIANPLRVKFTEVKACKANDDNKIEWKNLTEENIERYEIERSGNGTIFNAILSVSPKSNNGMEQEYSVLDQNILNETNFYRIKAIETDGSFTYSIVVKVIANNTVKNNASVFPNPVNSEQFTLQLNNFQGGNYNLKLMNLQGRQLMNKSLQHSGGPASVTIERPSSIQPGIYILQIISGNVIENLKIIFK